MDAHTLDDLQARQRAISATRDPRLGATKPLQRARRSLLRRIFARKEATTFHRCLAVHMHFAERRGILN